MSVPPRKAGVPSLLGLSSKAPNQSLLQTSRACHPAEKQGHSTEWVTLPVDSCETRGNTHNTDPMARKDETPSLFSPCLPGLLPDLRGPRQHRCQQPAQPGQGRGRAFAKPRMCSDPSLSGSLSTSLRLASSQGSPSHLPRKGCPGPRRPRGTRRPQLSVLTPTGSSNCAGQASLKLGFF